jgi:acetate kinase
MELDAKANERDADVISARSSRVRIRRMTTDEELTIARAAEAWLAAR